jgi:hypothetical protein
MRTQKLIPLFFIVLLVLPFLGVFLGVVNATPITWYNGTFESGSLSPYYTTIGSAVITNAFQHSGTYSAKLPNGGGVTYNFTTNNGGTPLVDSNTDLTLWVYASVNVYAYFTDGSSAFTQEASGSSFALFSVCGYNLFHANYGKFLSSITITFTYSGIQDSYIDDIIFTGNAFTSVYAKVADGSDSVCKVSIIDMGKPFNAPQINYTEIAISVSLPFIYGHQYSFCAYGEGNSTVRWCDGATNYTSNPLRLILYNPVNMTAYYTAGGTIFTGGNNGGAQTGINFLSSGHGSLNWTVTTEPQLGDTGNTGNLGFYGGFIIGDTISLIAVPDSGYTFSSFNVGALPYSNSPTTFTFYTNTTVTVNFITIGSGGGNGGGNILSAFGVSDNWLAVGVYVVCIAGMAYAFFALHNNNIPFAVALGLIIATIICNIINVLGIYTYPIDALTIFSIVGIIIFMRH